MVFFIHTLLVYFYILLNCNSKQTQSHTSIEDGQLILYLAVHVSWIDRQFQKHHAALAVRHFGHQAVNNILVEYGPEYGLVGLGHASSKNHGLGWVRSICCWVGLGQQIWTHVHLCIGHFFS